MMAWSLMKASIEHMKSLHVDCKVTVVATWYTKDVYGEVAVRAYAHDAFMLTI
eukprot:jgi/Botrbrau1/7639/Bobra.0159s0085.1